MGQLDVEVGSGGGADGVEGAAVGAAAGGGGLVPVALPGGGVAHARAPLLRPRGPPAFRQRQAPREVCSSLGEGGREEKGGEGN